MKPLGKGMECRSSHLSSARFLAAVFAAFAYFFLLGEASATETPTVIDVMDTDEGGNVAVSCERLDSAMWYQIYVQRNGGFFTSEWIRGDERFSTDETSISLFLGNLPLGQYEFWARAWEPIYGFSDWSISDTFEISCAELLTPEAMIDFMIPNSWPQYFTFYSIFQNITTSWGQIEIVEFPGGAVHGNLDAYFDTTEKFGQWVQYDYPGQGGVTIRSLADAEAFLADGDYLWRCREYSACNGVTEWSEPAALAIEGTDCEMAEPLMTLEFSEFENFGGHLYHHASLTVGAGSTPTLDIDFSALTWVNVFIRNADTLEVVFYEWAPYFDPSGTNFRMPKLAPGNYEIWNQTYHHQCGVSAWSDGPVNTFTVKEAMVTDVALGDPERNVFGEVIAPFEAQVGIDWYQFYVVCGNRVILNQWIDLESREFSSDAGFIVYQNYDLDPPYLPTANWNLAVFEACTEPFAVYSRAYSTSGELSEWASVSNDTSFNKIAPTNVILAGDGIGWTADGFYVGGFDIYIQRNGDFYYEAYVESDDFENPAPTSYVPFFDFSGGTYSIWVRSRAGAGISPWSEPLIFDLPF